MTSPHDAADPVLTDEIASSAEIAHRYRMVRGFSETLAEPLSPEDCCIQSMPDVSPTKWHLAHTSWFFETFLLEGRGGYEPFDRQFRVLFNSYYNGVGEQFPRPQRGLLSRPSLADILYYRQYVDEALLQRLENDEIDERTRRTLEIGLQHEQQHQELLLTDIKHVMAQNPLLPVYREGDLQAEVADEAAAEAPAGPAVPHRSGAVGDAASRPSSSTAQTWRRFDEGLYEIGHAGAGFAYDNESPRHRVYVEAFALAHSTVTCGQWLEFVQAGGYDDPRLWLSLGWSSVQQQGWQAPLYWFEREGTWWQFTLAGPRPVDPHAPVCHISYFEADAFARWSDARLPTEAEWEIAAADVPIAGHFVDALLAQDAPLHPQPGSDLRSARRGPVSDKAAHEWEPPPGNLFGNVWEWTASPYTPYPGYAPPEGALGEYNGKFMAQQYVLRGGSVATHSRHIRSTYRNFFPPEARWQFSGLRLARSA